MGPCQHFSQAEQTVSNAHTALLVVVERGTYACVCVHTHMCTCISRPEVDSSYLLPLLSYLQRFLVFLYIFFLFRKNMHVEVKGQLGRVCFLLHCVVSGDWTQVTWLGGKCFIHWDFLQALHLIFFTLLLGYVYVHFPVYYIICMEGRGQLEGISFSTVWILGIELRWSDLAAGTFTHQTTLPAHLTLFFWACLSLIF